MKAKSRMAHIGYDKNEYGTRISKHLCDTCGKDFTVCPAQPPEAKGWGNCLAPECTSYDPTRDVDKFLEEGGTIQRGLPKRQA